MAYIFTQEQFEELKKRILRTKKELEKLLEEKAGAHEPGDTWHAAPFRIAYVEEVRLRKRLADLKNLASSAKIIEPKEQNEKVAIGNRVVIEYEDGSQERLIMEGYIMAEAKNRVSIYSPMGKALKGGKKGQTKIVEIHGGKPACAKASAGRQKIKILEILPPSKIKM